MALRHVLILSVALLTIDAVLTEHAIEHSFAEEDGVCLSCDKANNLHPVLVTADLSALLQPFDVANSIDVQLAYSRKLAVGYSPRAPPVSS